MAIGEILKTTAREAYQTGLAKAFGTITNDWVETDDGAYIKDDSIANTSKKNVVNSNVWKMRPPSIVDFFGTFESDPKKAWFYEPFYPIQQRFVEAMIGCDPLTWDMKYDEGHNFWGKGGGKDRTIAKLLVYVAAKLLHMYNPQKGLEQLVGEGTIGIDSPIDIVNVSKDRDQARDVFFKNFKSIIKKIKNPHTGNNFFAEQGVDLRDGHDVQVTEVIFPHNITCHSLNSKQYAGEGLNLFYVVADEIGASPVKQVRDQLISIRETIDSRFPKVGKLMLMSFKYSDNCAMTIEYKLGEKDKRVFSSKASTWEVNPKKLKSNYKRHYIRNIEKAKWTYECKETREGSGGYVKQKYMIPWCLNDSLAQNPFIDDIISSDNILSLKFKSWFFEKLKGKNCAIHIDLAKGRKESGGDCAGISMTHPEMLKPRLHPKSIEFLKKLGFIIDESDSQERKGVIIDFMLQLYASSGMEIQFADIITFILGLRNKGINIFKVTYDGWQSVGEVQRIMNEGIMAEELSVDRTTGPYDTAKDLLYMGLLNGYNNLIAIREFRELIKLENGKIDHPEVSWQRLEDEGVEHGSKDISDSIAGSSYVSIKEIPISSGIVW